MKMKFDVQLAIKMAMLSMCLLSVGCKTYVVIPANREIILLKKNQPAPIQGYLVPPLRMLEILDALGQKEIDLHKEK